MSFQHELGDEVTVGEAAGVVLGRTEYVSSLGEPQYYVEFTHPQTKLPAREWFPEPQVIAA